MHPSQGRFIAGMVNPTLGIHGHASATQLHRRGVLLGGVRRVHSSVVANNHPQVTFVPRSRDQIVVEGTSNFASLLVEVQAVGVFA